MTVRVVISNQEKLNFNRLIPRRGEATDRAAQAQDPDEQAAALGEGHLRC